MMIEFEHPNFTDSQVIDHEEFLARIKKTLYYGSAKVRCTKISRPLADYAADVFSETHRGHSLSRLNFATVGKLTVAPCSLILAMIYLDRLNATDPTFVRRVTPSELFIVSMMVSTKFYCGYDEDIYLSAWAESGNMTREQMKSLELEFLDAMNWKAYVSKHDFFAKLKSVEKVLAKRQGLTRGWLTYTELINFLPSFAMAKQLIHYTTVMALSYTASVMTIAGAFLLASNLQLPGNLLYRGSTSMSRVQLSGTSNSSLQSGLAEDLADGTSLTSETDTLEDCIMDGPITAPQMQAMNETLKDCENALSSGPRREQLNEKLHGTNKWRTDSYIPYRYPHIRFICDSTGSNTVVSQIDFLHPDEEPRRRQENAAAAPDVFAERTDQGSQNCSYDHFIPLMLDKGQWCPDSGDHEAAGGMYKHYRQTYDMFSSFLKFL
ncbi:protein CNPPD1 [Anopheles bellator]|uniref:protein CNPPD1 n=1 Tax=Anopheles bellator TaxID=139047 RepID=UPI0026482676|nr:protein CNPPD1 [Anopheles bellator]